MKPVPAHTTFLFGAAVMFLSGIGIPVMAALNAGLGKGLGNPVAATAVLFAVAFGLALVAYALAGAPRVVAVPAVAPQFYSGAVFVVFYVLAVTYFAPRIGVGNAVFFVLVGQMWPQRRSTSSAGSGRCDLRSRCNARRASSSWR